MIFIIIMFISGVLVTFLFRYLMIMLFTKINRYGEDRAKKATIISLLFLVVHWTTVFILIKHFDIDIGNF
jgi:hypothetical protein